MDTVNRVKLSMRLAALSSSVSFLIVITVNALANALPINGVNTGQLSDELPNLFVPAGLTFSIWGLIYLLLAGYAIAVVMAAFGKKTAANWMAADGWIFSLNMAANVGWIFAWQYRQVGISLALMLVILATLVWLEERNASRERSAGGTESSGALQRFLLSTPVNVYLGWICVATIANVTALLVKAGWNGFGIDPRAWTVALIAAGLAAGLLLAFLRKAVAAPLVIVWAYVGIVLKRTQTDGSTTRIVWIAAGAAAAILLVVAVARYISFKIPKRA
ncbi:MAG: tryptophan-rich sensory protein [Spirochaetaceae bacterium]|nr:tryptophan-rich sensory protein [Spirochaetaceae bacterium]